MLLARLGKEMAGSTLSSDLTCSYPPSWGRDGVGAQPWAHTGAPGGVSCKPVSASGWLSSGIKRCLFSSEEKRLVIVTCLSDVKSIFDTSAEVAETALLGDSLRGTGRASTSPQQCRRENKSCTRGWCYFNPHIMKKCGSGAIFPWVCVPGHV